MASKEEHDKRADAAALAHAAEEVRKWAEQVASGDGGMRADCKLDDAVGYLRATLARRDRKEGAA